MNTASFLVVPYGHNRGAFSTVIGSAFNELDHSFVVIVFCFFGFLEFIVDIESTVGKAHLEVKIGDTSEVHAEDRVQLNSRSCNLLTTGSFQRLESLVTQKDLGLAELDSNLGPVEAGSGVVVACFIRCWGTRGHC